MKDLKKEFDRRVKTLNIDKAEKEELWGKFQKCWANGFKCAYCNNKMDLKYENEYGWTIDHVIPRYVGGKDNVENLTFCCRDCNFQKKIMNEEDYRTKMEKIKLRKEKREYFKAKKSTKRDERARDAYKDIFQMVSVKNGRRK